MKVLSWVTVIPPHGEFVHRPPVQNEFKHRGTGGARARDTLLSKGIRRATGEIKTTKGKEELNKSANLCKRSLGGAAQGR